MKMRARLGILMLFVCTLTTQCGPTNSLDRDTISILKGEVQTYLDQQYGPGLLTVKKIKVEPDGEHHYRGVVILDNNGVKEIRKITVNHDGVTMEWDLTE